MPKSIVRTLTPGDHIEHCHGCDEGFSDDAIVLSIRADHEALKVRDFDGNQFEISADEVLTRINDFAAPVKRPPAKRIYKGGPNSIG